MTERRRYEPDTPIYFPDEIPQHAQIEGLPLPEAIAPDTEGSVVRDNGGDVVDVTIPGYPLDILPIPPQFIRPNN